MMNFSTDIAEIEDELEGLAEAAERCRKIMIVAKLAVAGGAIIVTALALGLLRPDALVLLSGLTAIVAGIALYGTHRSTLADFNAQIAARELHRRGLIDALELPVVQPS